MTRTTLAMLASLGAIGALFVLLADGTPQSENSKATRPIVIYCAASNRAVMEAVRADYEKECGRQVQVQYGPSQTLLSSIEVSRTGDLYLPADDSYLKLGQDKQLIAEVLPVARMQGVIAVRRGNPKSIKSFADLLRDDVRLVQANPDAAAIGKLTRQFLEESGQWSTLDKATIAYRTTVTDVANDILVGAADAGIVYDAVLHTYPDLEAVEIEPLQPARSQIALGVIASSDAPAAALHFARYVTARDRGLKHYQQHGFRTEKGDAWSDSPELTIFAGSMLRPALEDTLVEFQTREGIRINRVYNGCGILVAQMQAGQRPDVYFACDTEFMTQVPDLFPDSVPVSQNELVIMVQKGNPHGIRDLRDLGREGLRVGIGHEKQCAMGWLTQNTLREGGVQEVVMQNVTVQTPTGDMLVNQLRTGSLDAAVAYLSNAAGSGEYLDAIRIEGLQCAIATQPFAITPESAHYQIARRLFDRICTTESQEIFAAEGFRWQLEQQQTPSKGDSDKQPEAAADPESEAVPKPAAHRSSAPH